MKNQTTKLTHSRMISICLTTVMLLGLFFIQTSHAQGRTIVYEYTGTLERDRNNNACNFFDGVSFHWVGSVDADATPVYTNGVNVEEFAGDISVTFTGANNPHDNGTYSNFLNNVIVEGVAGNNDYIQFEGSFSVFGTDIFHGYIELPRGFTGVPSPTNTPTPFSSTDVSEYSNWSISFGGEACSMPVINGVASGIIIEIFDDGFENQK